MGGLYVLVVRKPLALLLFLEDQSRDLLGLGFLRILHESYDEIEGQVLAPRPQLVEAISNRVVIVVVGPPNLVLENSGVVCQFLRFLRLR